MAGCSLTTANGRYRNKALYLCIVYIPCVWDLPRSVRIVTMTFSRSADAFVRLSLLWRRFGRRSGYFRCGSLRCPSRSALPGVPILRNSKLPRARNSLLWYLAVPVVRGWSGAPQLGAVHPNRPDGRFVYLEREPGVQRWFPMMSHPKLFPTRSSCLWFMCVFRGNSSSRRIPIYWRSRPLVGVAGRFRFWGRDFSLFTRILHPENHSSSLHRCSWRSPGATRGRSGRKNCRTVRVSLVVGMSAAYKRQG